MRHTAVALVLLAFFFTLSCNTTEPPPHRPEPSKTISLAVEDVGVTEVWLRVTVADTVANRTVVLERDGKPFDTTFVPVLDSILVDDCLLPNHLYTYVAYRLNGSSVQDTSDVLQVSTLDTTDHLMMWQIDTLGDGSSSILYDVAIINDTLIYGVGEIFVKDSLGNWINPPFNLVKWNGRDWATMQRLFDCRLYYPNCGPTFFLYSPVLSVFAFEPSDIWIAAGTAQHFNGVRWTEFAGIQGVGSAARIWGRSSNDIWFIGPAGFIAHKSENTWQQVPSGTITDMKDLWGCSDLSPGSYFVLAVGSSPEETRILSLSGGTARDTLDWPTENRLSGIWIDNGSVVYVSGAGVWRHKGSTWEQMSGLPDQVFLTGVRGTNENDIFAVAWRGIVTHFNGVSWHQYAEIPEDLNFNAVAVSEDLVVAVGFTGGLFSDKAVALIGHRLP